MESLGGDVTGKINLIKLSVGTEGVDSLAKWQARKDVRTKDGLPRHVTRMWPKREAEILNGGSIYWVIKGVIQARQRIVRLEEIIRADGIRRWTLRSSAPKTACAARSKAGATSNPRTRPPTCPRAARPRPTCLWS